MRVSIATFACPRNLARLSPLALFISASTVSGQICLCFILSVAHPLFMTGAIAVGMFHNISVGYVIVASHYISAVAVGLILGLFGRGHDVTPPIELGRGSVVYRAFKALSTARRKDGRPIGKVMGDAVKESINSLLMIGGFIILFSVLVRILDMVGVVEAVSAGLASILVPLGWNASTIHSLTSGFFEITVGAQAASQSAAPLVARVMAASAVIDWSGLSVHAQVAAVTQGTDIRIGVYIAARVLHAVLAAVCSLFLMGPAQATAGRIAPVIQPVPASPLVEMAIRLQYFGARFAICSGALLGLSLILSILRMPQVIFTWIGRPRRR